MDTGTIGFDQPHKATVLTYPDYQALTIQRYSDNLDQALKIVTLPGEAPGAKQVRVRNLYAGVNGFYDYGLISGAIQRSDDELPSCFGFESLGVVEACGSDCELLTVGQTVVSVGFGCAYREFFCANEDALTVMPKPDPRLLALLPSGISALLALTRVGQMGSGESVFIDAAAGGLGHIATQLAVRAGNRVVVSAGSDQKLERLSKFGVDALINYKTTELAEVLPKLFPNGIDLVLDTVGGKTFDVLVDNLANHARLVTAGHSSDTPHPEPVLAPRIYEKLYWRSASVRAFMNPLFVAEQSAARATLVAMLERDEIEVWVHEPMFSGLAEIPTAIACLRSGQNTGKVIVQISEA